MSGKKINLKPIEGLVLSEECVDSKDKPSKKCIEERLCFSKRYPKYMDASKDIANGCVKYKGQAERKDCIDKALKEMHSRIEECVKVRESYRMIASDGCLSQFESGIKFSNKNCDIEMKCIKGMNFVAWLELKKRSCKIRNPDDPKGATECLNKAIAAKREERKRCEDKEERNRRLEEIADSLIGHLFSVNSDFMIKLSINMSVRTITDKDLVKKFKDILNKELPSMKTKLKSMLVPMLKGMPSGTSFTANENIARKCMATVVSEAIEELMTKFEEAYIKHYEGKNEHAIDKYRKDLESYSRKVKQMNDLISSASDPSIKKELQKDLINIAKPIKPHPLTSTELGELRKEAREIISKLFNSATEHCRRILRSKGL